MYHACTVVQGCISQWPKYSAGAQILTPHISVTAEPIVIKIEPKNYHPKGIHHVKLSDDGSLSLFWFLSHAHRSYQWTDFNDLYYVFPCKDVPLEVAE